MTLTGVTPLFPNSTDDIPELLDPYLLAKTVKGPYGVRQALNLSQSQMGQVLGQYIQRKPPTKSAICDWEAIERGRKRASKYAMTPATREAYRALVAEVVLKASGERMRLKVMRLGPRRWKFAVTSDCVDCGKAFILKHARAVRCARCLSKRRKKIYGRKPIKSNRSGNAGHAGKNDRRSTSGASHRNKSGKR